MSLFKLKMENGKWRDGEISPSDIEDPAPKLLPGNCDQPSQLLTIYINRREIGKLNWKEEFSEVLVAIL